MLAELPYSQAMIGRKTNYCLETGQGATNKTGEKEK